MSDITVGAIASTGMNHERNRLEMASMKLAIANVPYSSMSEAIQAMSKLDTISGIEKKGSNHPEQVKTVYDPSHPLANSSGQVFFIKVDPVHEMATLVSALRAYQANVRAYNTNGDFNQAALAIGGKK